MSEHGDEPRYDDLPHMFEQHGFPNRASALRRLIDARDSLLCETAKARKKEYEKAEARKLAELEEVEAAYITVAEIRGKAKTALQKYGAHLPDCLSITRKPREPSEGWGKYGSPAIPPCDCGYERLLQGGL